jgi:UPF0755 protein
MRKWLLLLLGLLGGSGIILALLFVMNRETITVAEAGPQAGAQRAGPVGWATALYLSLRAGAIDRPATADGAPVSVTIEPGETAPLIADRLAALGLIDDPLLFRLFLRYNDLDTSLEAGDYALRRDMSLREVALALQRGRASEVDVTIPEGWRAEQIAERLEALNLMEQEAFLALVWAGIDHPVLSDHPSGQSLEGYLYPDTYRLAVDASPEDLLALMLDNLAAQLPAGVEDLAQEQGLTFYEVLTLASIVEREAVLDEERPTIASVYLNRLNNSRNYLESDATAQYAMGFQADSGQWWKTPVTLDELTAAESPYNTYLNPGLPPGPIANPGIASIEAVLQPAQTDYLFFVCARPNCEGGNHVFAKTYEEHLRNVKNYYGQ